MAASPGLMWPGFVTRDPAGAAKTIMHGHFAARYIFRRSHVYACRVRAL